MFEVCSMKAEFSAIKHCFVPCMWFLYLLCIKKSGRPLLSVFFILFLPYVVALCVIEFINWHDFFHAVPLCRKKRHPYIVLPGMVTIPWQDPCARLAATLTFATGKEKLPSWPPQREDTMILWNAWLNMELTLMQQTRWMIPIVTNYPPRRSRAIYVHEIHLLRYLISS